jgi:hypothetical protein
MVREKGKLTVHLVWQTTAPGNFDSVQIGILREENVALVIYETLLQLLYRNG